LVDSAPSWFLQSSSSFTSTIFFGDEIWAGRVPQLLTQT